MRHLAFTLALAMAPVTMPVLTSPALAQQGQFAPVVYVNNAAVTRFELDQRLRFMQVLGMPGADAATAEAELINDRLKMQAAETLGLTVSDESLDAGLAEFAGRAGMSTDQFIAALAGAGVERETYRDFVRAGVVWREVVRRQIVPQVRVSESEVDQVMKRDLETPVLNAVLLAELVIPAPPGQEAAARARAEQIIASTRSESDFTAAARRYSATPSASNGGRLPWMDLDNMPPSLRPIVLALRPGQVTQPLTVPGAVVLFYLRDMRGSLRPGAREQVLDYLTLPMASAAEAAQFSAPLTGCADLYVAARGLPLQEQSGLRQGQIPADIGLALAKLDENELTVINRGISAELVMLCRRVPALLANQETAVPTTAQQPDGVEAATADGLPQRAAVSDQVFNARINSMAEAYLAELRANAIMRRP